MWFPRGADIAHIVLTNLLKYYETSFRINFHAACCSHMFCIGAGGRSRNR